MHVRVLITGGTIDNLDYTDPADAPAGQQSVIPSLLEHINETDCTTEVTCFTDGRLITDSDRNHVLDRCMQCPEDAIVITHGTTTMCETARYLGERITGKTVVLTGAMVMPQEGDSDAQENLQSALAFAQSQKPGVYIAMHGKCFDWNNVRKDVEKGQFSEL